MLKVTAGIGLILVIAYVALREQAYGKYWECQKANNPYSDDLMSWDPSKGTMAEWNKTEAGDPSKGTMAEWNKTEAGKRYNKYEEIAEQKCAHKKPSFPFN